MPPKKQQMQFPFALPVIAPNQRPSPAVQKETTAVFAYGECRLSCRLKRRFIAFRCLEVNAMEVAEQNAHINLGNQSNTSYLILFQICYYFRQPLTNVHPILQEIHAYEERPDLKFKIILYNA